MAERWRSKWTICHLTKFPFLGEKFVFHLHTKKKKKEKKRKEETQLLYFADPANRKYSWKTWCHDRLKIHRGVKVRSKTLSSNIPLLARVSPKLASLKFSCDLASRSSVQLGARQNSVPLRDTYVRTYLPFIDPSLNDSQTHKSPGQASESYVTVYISYVRHTMINCYCYIAVETCARWISSRPLVVNRRVLRFVLPVIFLMYRPSFSSIGSKLEFHSPRV